jgi:hypothetical protein
MCLFQMIWIFNFIQIITLNVQFNRRVLYLEAVPPNVDFWNKINMYVCMYVYIPIYWITLNTGNDT